MKITTENGATVNIPTGRRQRRQDGSLFVKGDSCYLKYRTIEIRNCAEVAVHKTVFLCSKSDTHYWTPRKPTKGNRNKLSYSGPVLDLQREKMTEARTAPAKSTPATGAVASAPVSSGMTVANFWEHVYLPFAKENLRHSTVSGYQQIWGKNLTNELGPKILGDFRTHMGSEMLTRLAKKYGRRTIAHIRSLASGIFSHAVNTGLIESNPWRDVKVLGKVKAPVETTAYSLDELQEFIAALKDQPKSQLVVLLAGVMGMRPSELIALDFSDIDWAKGTVRIQRAFVLGVVDETKTEASKSVLPLIQPVFGVFKAYHDSVGQPAKGWVFPSSRGNRPTNVREFCRRHIKPFVGPKWQGLYCARRGAASIMTKLLGSPIAASQLLRHTNISTTMASYIKTDRSQLDAGMAALQNAWNGKGAAAE
jgi:integrase